MNNSINPFALMDEDQKDILLHALMEQATKQQQIINTLSIELQDKAIDEDNLHEDLRIARGNIAEAENELSKLQHRMRNQPDNSELESMLSVNWRTCNKIPAIKMVRTITGTGLKEAKELVERSIGE